ncbi:Tc toxin subunit A-related protein [Nonomuraea sp. NPDC004186]
MAGNEPIPSYEELFDDTNLDHRQEDEARTVYSPGAYLADLLGLLETVLEQPSLLGDDRRADLKRVLLDGENTFGEAPYLDIVIELLERLAGDQPYERMRQRLKYPFGMPFSLDEERFKTYLRHLRTGPDELYRIFAPVADADTVARLFLGLSAEAVTHLTSPADEAGIKAFYGLAPQDPLTSLADVERFKQTTGLSALQLRELLGEPDDLVRPPKDSYVNQGSEPVTMSPDGTRLEGATSGWYDRISRIVRLARWTGLGLSDLDRVLTTCCGGTLDAAALRITALAVHLRQGYDLTVDAVCGLVAEVEPVPEELPAMSGDILGPHNKEYRRKLAIGIGTSESDIVETVRRYRDRYSALEPSPFDRGPIGSSQIALLRRTGRLTSALGMSAGELFDLLGVLESDPSLWRYSTFSLLGGVEPKTQDCYRILEGGDPVSGLWLAQTLLAVARWMQDGGFGAQELAEILGSGSSGSGGPGGPGASGGDDRLAVLEGLDQRFQAVAMEPAMFEGERFGPRAAQAVHDVLATHTGAVVSERDARLLRLDPDTVAVAAHEAVTSLGMIVDDDLIGLGLGERLAGKIRAQLVFSGRLRADGTLVTEGMPETDYALNLERDFASFKEALFKLINSVGNGTSSFYPSDLATVGNLSQGQLDELYDNLIYHGYVDEEGAVQDPAFFADEENVEAFRVNAGLSDVAPEVLTLLRRRIDAFRAEPLVLDPGLLTGLRLSEARLARLMDGLRFNGYIDENGRYLNKQALAALRPADFALPPEFHPHRNAVLDAAKRQIGELEAELYTFTPEDFTEVADLAMAQRAMAAMEGIYLSDGWPVAEVETLGDGFTAAETAIVARRVAECAQDERPYRIHLEALGELGFDDEQQGLVVEKLIAQGHLTDGLSVPREAVPFFANPANVVSFALQGLEDFERDVFFLLHAVAVALAEAVEEVTATLESRAGQQQEALTSALADAFGVPQESAAAICAGVAGGLPEAMEILIPPVIAVPRRLSDPHFQAAYERIRRFALLAGKLGMDETEVAVAFHDQDLTGKYPEPLALPPGVDVVDAVLRSSDGHIYVFAGDVYWAYSADTYALLDPRSKALTELSPRFTGLTRVDAAFAFPGGAEGIVGRAVERNEGDEVPEREVSRLFVKDPGSIRWAPRDQLWGKVRNNFEAPRRIDSAYVDENGRTYLFCADQYIRYSSHDFTTVDEGYPRGVAEWWQAEGHDTPLPEAFTGALDAAFQDVDGHVHLFAGGRYFEIGGQEQPISARWGRIRNAFDGAQSLDCAFTGPDGRTYLFRGNQVVRYTDSLENDGVRVDDGYPRRIETEFARLPGEFHTGVEAAFTEPVSGMVHLFKDGRTVSFAASGGGVPQPTAERWGKVADVLAGGAVDAGLVGMDGKTYLFSGERYIRYSGADYAVVDLGYPRRIAGDWGGLRKVGAAFVMDGKTYLFGQGGHLFDVPLAQEPELNEGRLSPALRRHFLEHGLTLAEKATVTSEGTDEYRTWHVGTEQGIALTLRRNPLHIQVHADGGDFHVRYSTRDYATPDAGYPKPVSDNWWNLPASLADDPRFAVIDAVFTDGTGRTYLFAGNSFVVSDARHRWWSEPRTIDGHWDSLLPFTWVDAAFVGKDGRTYVFSGDRYIRFSGGDYTRADDRYPASVPAYWGNVVNRIARTGLVDAALTRTVTEEIDGRKVDNHYTYLFSGDQYVRYLGTELDHVQDGYPAALSALSREPGMAALDVTLDGVDAAFADRRNVHLFRAGRCHIVSDGLYRRYDDASLSGLSCAFLEDGKLLAEDGNGWRHRAGIEAVEGFGFAQETGTPRSLRAAPEGFRNGLDAVLRGADGTTYLFKGPNCVNTRLNRPYLLAEEWGKPRNTIYQDNKVDAAFVGRDGRTYLFSGDQFVAYADPGPADTAAPNPGLTIDGEPRLISEHWGGLDDVALAYVRGTKTYLFESPDEEGRMRYLVYSGTDYTEPDGEPQLADESFWRVPEQYRIPGHPVPDAVLFAGDTMLLLLGEHCVQYDERAGAWSYPRPIERLWPGFERILESSREDGDALRTAFTAPDGSTYFFLSEQYSRHDGHDFAPLAVIRDRWGRSPNPFVPDDATARIDAACVFGDDTTFLISGDRYVRYTGSEYRYIDPGYPKKIVGNLRREAAFANLPESFDDAVTGRTIDAAIANGRTAYLFAGGSCHVVSRAATATRDLAVLGRVRNNLVEREKVDATIVTGAHTYLFSGDQYVRYTGTEYAYADDGYPRAILPGLAFDLRMQDPPADFADGLDAAFRTPGPAGVVHLIKGDRCLRVGEPAAQPVNALFGKVRNAFADAGHRLIDAAFAAPTGELYAFKGEQYVRYRPGALEFVEEGHPRTVRDDWGDLPGRFESGVDGAFVFEDRTYLCKGDEYVRYSRGYHEVDRTYPQRFRYRWGGTADYRLSDVHTISRFIDLARRHPDGLPAFLLDPPAVVQDPYAYLGDLFGWDVDEIRWAKRNAALLTAEPEAIAAAAVSAAPVRLEEDRFEVEFLLRLVELFTLTDRMGEAPSTLYTDVWRPAFGDPTALATANTALYGIMERLYTGEWEALSAAVHDEINVLKRDALVSIAPGTPGELYDRLLADVEMGGQGRTSRVREAIAAAQLYVHRYLLDLERVTVPDGRDPEETRRRIRTWWAWLKNYRLWEANRKVFLYPENYLRPELRGSKTPAFRALEDDLLQGEITQEKVEQAYKRYLDEYTEVSRLSIAGGYVYRADGAEAGVRRLVLFGRTRTEPRRYYCREAEFRDDGRLSATWEPWLKVDAQVEAEIVYPVHAFGRIFVFWPTAEAVAPEPGAQTTLTEQQSGDNRTLTPPPPKYRVRVNYSFRNLNGEWVPSQVLPLEDVLDAPVDAVSLYVQASATVPVPDGGTHDTILITCTYTVAKPEGPQKVQSAFALTPELYAIRAEGVPEPVRPSRLEQIFGEPIEESKVVQLTLPAGAESDPWISVDHKGGSFLCRPIAPEGSGEEPRQLSGNPDKLPVWSPIHAAVELPGGVRYFFNNTGESGSGPYYVEVSATRTTATRLSKPLTAERWGHVPTPLYNDKAGVDAAIVKDGFLYLFSGAYYYRYSGAPFGRIDVGYPKLINGNEEGFPQWDKVDAAAVDANGVEYYHSAGQHLWMRRTSPGNPLETFQPPWAIGNTPVGALLIRGDDVFLVNGDSYRRGDSQNERPIQLRGNKDGLPQSGPVSAPFRHGESVYFFNNDTHTYLSITREEPGKGRGQSGNGSREYVQSEPSPIKPLGVARTAVTDEGVDAAYVVPGTGGKDATLFLARNLEYVRYTLKGGEVAALADPGYPKPMSRRVRAVFQRSGLRYVFSDQDYTVLRPGEELASMKEFSPVSGNWGGLPDGWETGLDGVLDSTDLYLFLGSTYVTYPSSVKVQRPYEIAALPHEVIRLTSSTAYRLNKALLEGGVPALLAPEIQELDELPSFSTRVSDATTIMVTESTAEQGVPAGTHLDFNSGNGIYYWEVFFHAPTLIAQALNAAQRFDDARTWYEYVFDPTMPRYWRFLPFLAADVEALVQSCRHDLAELAGRGADVSKPAADLEAILVKVEPMAPAFQHQRELSQAEKDYLAELPSGGPSTAGVPPIEEALNALEAPPGAGPALKGLLERIALLGRLRQQYDLMGDRAALLKAYLEDPFDPHAIAELRPPAYRRAVVMAYVDNLLDWGDLLFRQYTAESVDEARMLYIFAYDLLGERPPEDLGPRALTPALTYEELRRAPEDDGLPELTAGGAMLEKAGEVHASVAGPYFHVPANGVFLEYWDRVEDRLRKIRASLDIMGVSRPLPLFEPPADVMALVRGAAAGASLDRLAAAATLPVPHYRFSSVFRKAQELVDKLRQFGGDLLSVLERRDSEELALLNNRHEGTILALTRAVREAEVEIAAQGLSEVQVSEQGAQNRVDHYEGLIAAGLTPLEQAQLGMMSAAVVAHVVATGFQAGAAIASGLPDVLLGLFIMGTKLGREQVTEALEHGGEASSSAAEALNVIGELLGIRAEQERMAGDWAFQLAVARNDVEQLGHQVKAAEFRLKAAQRELQILDQQIANQEAVGAFMTGKFTNLQLYQWMSGRLAGLYFQTYSMAYDMARSAQRSFQYERGVPEGQADYIQPLYWESRRNGLLAAESLGLDLERLGKAWLESDRRGLEITKKVSLLALDPVAALGLRTTGRCEFALTEALFDRDFPGHYRRRVKTVSVTFTGPEGPIALNAVLTQLDSRTVLAADPKAVKYLLDPKGPMPATLRADWRGGQQIALSDLEEYKDNNGLFDLRYDDERYLPFEGTGAVSRWRLELPSGGAPQLLDVTVTVKYSAEQGGELFAGAVKGMLKPYATARYCDIPAEFPEEWSTFVDGSDDTLTLPFTPDMFPGMTGRAITGVYALYSPAGDGSARFLLNGERRLTLNEGKLLPTPGLTAGTWRLVLEGDKSALEGLGLILSYRAR